MFSVAVSEESAENEFAQGFVRGAERRGLPTDRALLFDTGLAMNIAGLLAAGLHIHPLGLRRARKPVKAPTRTVPACIRVRWGAVR